MPFATIETNISEADIPQELCEKLTQWLAKTLEKPEGRISVTLLPGRHMMRGGSNAPLLHMELAAVGVISDGKQTGPLTGQLFAFLQELTGLAPDRITVLYKPIQPWQVGLNGATLG